MALYIIVVKADLLMLVKIILCITIGIAAGAGTGLAGISAAMVISPILIAYLGFPAYEAIGIALAVDVFSSSASSATFIRRKNTNIRACRRILVCALVFTAAGSVLSSFMPDSVLGHGVILCTIVMSVKFLFFPDARLPETITFEHQRKMVTAGSCAVGAICGLFGAGGGMMFMILLTCLLGYDIKTSLGTSLIIMTLVALLGAAVHFTVSDSIDWTVFFICAVSAAGGAKATALFANHASAKLLNIIIGIVFLILSASLIAAEYVIR